MVKMSRDTAAIKELMVKLCKGSLKRKFHIVEGGIEQAPVTLLMLFNGENCECLLFVPLK